MSRWMRMPDYREDNVNGMRRRRKTGLGMSEE
jgi:hypothetical protein